MLGNLLKLGNIEVIDIMVPRADIVAIPINSNFRKHAKAFLKFSQQNACLQ